MQIGTESEHGLKGLVDTSSIIIQSRGMRHITLRVGDMEIVDRGVRDSWEPAHLGHWQVVAPRMEDLSS